MKRAVWFGVAVLVWNLIATALAVAFNWPTQFGRVGTDAGAEFVAIGTAISAPLVPIAVLVVSLLLMRARGRSASVGLAGYCIVGVVFAIGGIGEISAAGTADTPKSVLIAGGVVAIGIGAAMIALAIRAFRERRQSAAVA